RRGALLRMGNVAEATRVAGRSLLRAQARESRHVHAAGGGERPLGGRSRRGGGRATRDRELPPGVRTGVGPRVRSMARRWLVRDPSAEALVRRARRRGGGGRRRRRGDGPPRGGPRLPAGRAADEGRAAPA